MAKRVGKNEEKSTIVLEEDFAYDLFEKYMLGHGWALKIRDVAGEAPGQRIEEVWGKDSFYGAVHYMDEPNLYSRYFWIHGQSIWPVVLELVERFGGPNETDLVDSVHGAQTVDELVVAIIQMAIGWADHYDPKVMQVLEEYAKHESPRVRSAVVHGLLYAKWSQGLPLLKNLADNDEAPIVREFASKVFEIVTRAQDE